MAETQDLRSRILPKTIAEVPGTRHKAYGSSSRLKLKLKTQGSRLKAQDKAQTPSSSSTLKFKGQAQDSTQGSHPNLKVKAQDQALSSRLNFEVHVTSSELKL